MNIYSLNGLGIGRYSPASHYLSIAGGSSIIPEISSTA